MVQADPSRPHFPFFQPPQGPQIGPQEFPSPVQQHDFDDVTQTKHFEQIHVIKHTHFPTDTTPPVLSLPNGHTNQFYSKWVVNCVFKASCQSCKKPFTPKQRTPCIKCRLCKNCCKKSIWNRLIQIPKPNQEHNGQGPYVLSAHREGVQIWRTRIPQQPKPKPLPRTVINTKFPDLIETDDQTKACNVCLTYQANALFLPCCHMCSCSDCIPHLNKCPVCRSTIQEIKPVYQT